MKQALQRPAVEWKEIFKEYLFQTSFWFQCLFHLFEQKDLVQAVTYPIILLEPLN